MTKLNGEDLTKYFRKCLESNLSELVKERKEVPIIYFEHIETKSGYKLATFIGVIG